MKGLVNKTILSLALFSFLAGSAFGNEGSVNAEKDFLGESDLPVMNNPTMICLAESGSFAKDLALLINVDEERILQASKAAVVNENGREGLEFKIVKFGANRSPYSYSIEATLYDALSMNLEIHSNGTAATVEYSGFDTDILLDCEVI